MSERPCILVCRVCGDDLVHPFDSYAARGRWASLHTAGTGHRTWFVFDGQPPLEQVAQLLVEHDADVAQLHALGITGR